MDHDPRVAEALAATHARDRAAYLSLRPAGQVTARRVGNWGFRVRRFVGALSHDALRWSERMLGVALDRLLWLLDKVLFGPYRVIARGLAAASRALVDFLKQVVGGVLWTLSGLLWLVDATLGRLARRIGLAGGNPGTIGRIQRWRSRIARWRRMLPIIRRRARRAIDRGWERLKSAAARAVATLGVAVDWAGRNLLFRPCAWLFDPVWPGGRPLLVHRGASRLLGFLLAALALYIGGVILAYIKAKALILHGIINTDLWKANASWLANMITIGAAHGAISLGVAMSKFVLLPVLAAARRGMKNNYYTKAIAFAYTRRRLAAERIDAKAVRAAVSREHPGPFGTAPAAHPTAHEPHRRPLKFLETLTHHIIAGTVPEAYEVKLAEQREAHGPAKAALPAPGPGE